MNPYLLISRAEEMKRAGRPVEGYKVVLYWPELLKAVDAAQPSFVEERLQGCKTQAEACPFLIHPTDARKA